LTTSQTITLLSSMFVAVVFIHTIMIMEQ